jgi:hypothetical protein
MASLLEGIENFVRKEVAKGFKNQLVKGLLRRESASTVDEVGDPVVGTVEEFQVEGIRDTFSASFAATAGIPTDDVRILLIGGLIAPRTDPRQDDLIRMRGTDGLVKWHKVRAVLTVDPANAHYVLQCFEVTAPV